MEIKKIWRFRMAKNSPQDVENREHFSNQLNKIMKSKGIRQIDISNALDIPKSTLTGYVKGRTLPNEENSKKIADLLGVPIFAIDKRFQPIPSVELQDYDYSVLDINQDISETLNEISRLKYCVIKLNKKNESPLFTGFRAIITDHDREIVIDPITVETFFDAFSRTDILIKHGYQSGSPEQFRDFDNYIWSRKREDKEILENVISDWLAILNIDKQHVNISYFDKAIATPNKVKLKI